MTAFRVHYAATSDQGPVARSRLARRALHCEQQRRGRQWTRAAQRWGQGHGRVADTIVARDKQDAEAIKVIEEIELHPQIDLVLEAHPDNHPRNRNHEWGRPRVRDRNGRFYDRVWNRQLYRLFIAGLTAIGNVRAVSRQIGVSSQTLYRRRLIDPMFGVDWTRALSRYVAELEDMLALVALRGQKEEIWYRGHYAGTVVRHDHRLALQLLYLQLEREQAAHDHRLSTGVEVEEAMDWVRANWHTIKRMQQWKVKCLELARFEQEADRKAERSPLYFGHEAAWDS